jgi:hypothetical protein
MPVAERTENKQTPRHDMAARERPSRREAPPSGAAAQPTAELCYYEVRVPASPSSNAQTSSGNLTRTRKTVNVFSQSHHMHSNIAASSRLPPDGLRNHARSV